MTTPVEREMKAYEALIALLREAEHVRRLFVDAGITSPPRIESLLADSPASVNGAARSRKRPTVTIEPMPSPEAPREARPNWVWIPCKEASAVTLVMAILAEKGEPVRPRALVEVVSELNATLTSGGVYNIGPRLDKAGKLVRGDGGWILTQETEAPVIHEEHVWGPPDVFQKQELAFHRRKIITHILRGTRGGLQIVQIVDHLANYDGCQAPVNKDLVKMDMKALVDAGEVRRVGNSKKYTPIEKEE